MEIQINPLDHFKEYKLNSKKKATKNNQQLKKRLGIS